MKKDKAKTHGYTLTMVILLIVGFLSILYVKWYFCDREHEVDKRQTQDMVDYHRSQGRDIQVY